MPDTNQNESTNQPIVKYDRELYCQFVGLNQLDKVESDLFYSVLSILRERKQVSTVISAKDLIKRSEYLEKRQKKYSLKNMVKYIKEMAVDVSTYSVLVDSPESIHIISLFDSFSVNKTTADLTVTLGHSFSNIFFNIKNNNLTRFYLKRVLHMRGKHTGNLYRLLLDRHSTFTMELKDFARYFGLKNPNTISQFFRRLPGIIKKVQATGDFEDKEPIRFSRNKVHMGKEIKETVTFTFRERDHRIVERTVDSEAAGKAVDGLPACPHCGKAMRWYKNTKTGEMYIGHVDFKHCTCKPKSYPSRDSLDAEILAVKQRAEKKAADAQEQMKDRIIADYIAKHPDKAYRADAEETAPDFNKIPSGKGLPLPSIKDTIENAKEEQRRYQAWKEKIYNLAVQEQNGTDTEEAPFPMG